ncbi:hypothetical protein K320107C7_09790 [Alistipes shahii]|uniref:hypothetical protein n=1 Tax=Alistipes shahii TaxID=328814 RepID=UPI0036F35C86
MEKPIIEVDLQGPDGNVFALMAEARAAMIAAVPCEGSVSQRQWNREKAEAKAYGMMRAMMQSHSYDEALSVIRRYVTIQEKGGEPMR